MSGDRTTITIEVTEETLALLEVLGKGFALGGNGSAADVVAHLVHSAADGVRRPGAWERAWVMRVCGDDWVDLLEQDADVPSRRRPRRGTKP
jgi:hypothetical protein